MQHAVHLCRGVILATTLLAAASRASEIAPSFDKLTVPAGPATIDGEPRKWHKITLTFDVRWFNPRAGGRLQNASVKTVRGPGQRRLGAPPSETDKDWIILVTRSGR